MLICCHATNMKTTGFGRRFVKISAVHGCDPTLSVSVVMVSRKVFFYVVRSALQFIVSFVYLLAG